MERAIRIAASGLAPTSGSANVASAAASEVIFLFPVSCFLFPVSCFLF